MNKKLIFSAVTVLLISLFIATAVVIAKCELARLTITNNTHLPVAMSLTKGETFYYLTVPAGATKIFTVDREVYDRTSWACEKTDSGTLNMKTMVKLTFTKCFCSPPNAGETNNEKVSLPDTPSGINWKYR
jgi:hypothetical protein